MRLKKLILHGFKSFADRVEIAFEGGITGVVGPNGCGKSNIADAVRWVLGEQSAKSLRGSKMEDVIFNGTERRRRLAFCEVSLVFDNEDKALPIEFLEVSVTRRVYRTGESEYRINGAACRLKDIIDLFRDTGVGKDGYSLIGQGRIDEILSQKSEDRRQVFEEAAGIVKYKARKLEAQRRMERTRDNLSRVEDILGELESRVEPLKKQSEEAREYLTLRDELKVLDLNVFLVRSRRDQERIADLNESIARLTEALENAQARLAELNERRAALQQALEGQEERSAQAREEVQRLIRSVESHEGSSRVLEERGAAVKRERERLLAEREAASSGSEGIRDRIMRLEAAVEGEAAELERAQVLQREAEAALNASEGELNSLEEQAESEKQAIIQAMNRLGDVRSQRARLSAMQTAIADRLSGTADERQREQEGEDSLRQQVDEARETLAAEQARLKEAAEQIEQVAARLETAGAAIEAANEEASRLKTLYEQGASRLKLLKEMQRDYEGYNNSVKQVLMQARRTQGSGVHGVVADLIHVPERLERAMDMVLGGALQNVVVDRDEDAKRMIEYLRRNRYGRATFLPIGSVRGRTLSSDERRVLAMPGCVGVASELISYEPIYQGVVDNLLGRTVVAEDLDSGIAIQRASRYQLRLVTLQGDVMHSGGSMTGGSVQSRTTSLLSRGREIAETEKQLKAITGELSALRERFAHQEEERAQLKRQRGELYDALHRQEVLSARAETQLNAVLEEQKNNRERVARMEDERSRLQAQLSEIEGTLAGLTEKQSTAEQSHAVRQDEVRRLQERIYELRTILEKKRAEVTDARVALVSRERSLENKREECKRFRSQAADTARILATTAEALQNSERELEQNQRESAEVRETLAREKAALDAARSVFEAEDARRTASQRELQECAAQAESLRVESEQTADKQHRSQIQLTRVEAEQKQLQDRIWEDYELSEAGAESFRVEDFKLGESEKRIGQIRHRIREMGSVNVAAVDEYRSTCQRVEEMSAQRDDLLKAETDLQDIVEELEAKMEVQFKQQFHLMNENFQRTFVKLFGGGKAELRLTDPGDALNCGIEIAAQPPGKKLQMLSLLSGGERALTAIAILFAILDLKPTPFCILDEIEAALDDANIDTYADYLKDYSRNTQFIVITHRKGTMERCDSLYGVVMEEKGISRTVSVMLSEAEAV